MFGFIKKLFSGIVAFFSGLFGGKKESQEDTSAAPKVKKGKDFFLELDEAGSGKAQEAPAKKPEPAKAEGKGEVSQPKPEAAKTATATAERPKAEKPAPAENGKVAPQPNPPAAAATNGKVEMESEEMTFAPNYLLPVTNKPRRRPGPSLDMFRDMARNVKAPGA
jgi:uncharacterized membrane protein